MKAKGGRITGKRLDALIVVALLVGVCATIVMLRIQDLYDVVRYTVAAILLAYLGWAGISRIDASREDRDDE